MRTLTLLYVAMFLAGCSDQLDRQIKIVLPNDYRGEFTIVKDKSGTPYVVNSDSYVFSIPPSGELRTPDVRPFSRWHQVRIEYEDGRVLPVMARDIPRGHGVVAEHLGMVAGQRQTGPSSWEGSSDYDGTTLRWEVRAAP